KMWRFSAFLRRCTTTSSSRHYKKVLFGSTIPYFSYRHPDVKEALAGQRPVVALESTIITQGMPYLHSLSTVKEVEVIVRAEGAVPATTGILEGRIHVVSRRDLPYVISKGLSGGTTVSGTMIVAHRAGIPVFVTGDIGRTVEFFVSARTQLPFCKLYILSLGLQSGLLLAVPIPEEHAGQQKEDAIQTAVTEASSKGVTGRDVTPFMLQRVNELTEGKSLQASIHLKTQKMMKLTIVIGGINVDFIAKGTTKKLVVRSLITKILLVCNVTFILLLMNVHGDMDIHQQIQEQYAHIFEKHTTVQKCGLILDGNIPVLTTDYVCCIAKKRAVPVWFEPTDADKACKPFLSESWKALSYTTPNMAELCTMNHTLDLPTPTELPRSLDDVLGCIPALSCPLLEHLHCVVVTLGVLGVMVCGEHDAGTVNLQPQKQKRKGRLCAIHCPALTVSSGAGDSFAGAMMFGILQGLDTDSCVRMGLLAARTSLLSPHPKDPSLTADAIHPEKSHSQLWSKPTCVWMED
uniref:Zgc:136858 n=1 Tax=Cyprinus carpio TaxID=7962 RepID=A0A8C1WUC7_CYPCA